MKKHTDLLAGLGALAWSVLAVTVLPRLQVIISEKPAAAFGVVALARWYYGQKKAVPEQADDAQK